MAEIRLPRLEQDKTKMKNVPVVATPEGFWCCPSPAVFQKSLKNQSPPLSLNKPKSSVPKIQNPVKATSSSRTNEKTSTNGSNASSKNEKATIQFGEPGSSDIRVILMGEEGLSVKLSVHRSVLVDHSSFFAGRISEQQPIFPCLEIENCDDVEIYAETIGLMYCKQVKQRLMKQNVSRVLQILKVSKQLGFTMCTQSCLEYLEAVPWEGEHEEQKVVSSVSHLEDDEDITVQPILKRVTSGISTEPPIDTLSRILELVLKSKDEQGRRKMKSIVLNLLKENNNLPTSSDSWNKTLYASCRHALDTLLSLFRQDAEPESKSIALETDNLLWLLDILSDRQAADQFATLWANNQELASLHKELTSNCRYHVSMISARIFVGIGRGELLPCKDTRVSLLNTWLEPLIIDYRWLLQHNCRSLDRNVIEEGIGRTILTLPLEDQKRILVSWLGVYLKVGDNCPNLKRAFEVWWRRTFIRSYVESGVGKESGGSTMLKVECDRFRPD